MHFITLTLLVLGALTVSHAQDKLYSHEVLKRLLSALTEKKQEEPVVQKSLWDELEEELTKRKEAVNNIFYLFCWSHFCSILINKLFIISQERISVECQCHRCEQTDNTENITFPHLRNCNQILVHAADQNFLAFLNSFRNCIFVDFTFPCFVLHWELVTPLFFVENSQCTDQ